MDPAELDKFKQMLSSQVARVNQHETSLLQVMEHLQRLTASMTQLSEQMAVLKDQIPPSSGIPASAITLGDNQLTNPAPQAREPYIPTPARYSGDLGTCSQFLHQCNLVFSQQPLTYATSQSKIAFIVSLLSGREAAWSLAISIQQPELTLDHFRFTGEMKRVFDHPVKEKQAQSRLLELQQNHLSVSEYAIEFRILAVESGWDDSALQAIFLKGLTDKLKDELAVREESDSLNSLIDLAVLLDNRIRERDRERKGKKAFPSTQTYSPAPGPQ